MKQTPVGLAAIVVIAVSLLGVGCSADDDAPDDRPLVVATHSILGDVVRNVVGDQAHVEVVMPAGADPHEFEPSAADVAELHEADLIVQNGLGFEAGMEDALAAAGDDGALVLDLGAGLDPLPLADGSHEAEQVPMGEEPHTGDQPEDPHWFTDPMRMAEAAVLIADAVESLSGVDAELVARQGATYADRLRAASAYIEAELAVIPSPDRELVTNHEVFAYFADRYGLKVIGVIIPGGSTLAEPSSAGLTALAEDIQDAGTRAIFADTSSPTELADALADATGGNVEVVPLYSESLGPPDSDGATYLDMIHTNADRIVAALT